MNRTKRKLTLICGLHYVKLAYRAALFVAAAVAYILSRVRNTGDLFQGFEREYWLLGLIWLVYAAEMACRFFPSRFESMGCQKQFQRNYQPTGEAEPRLQSPKRTLAVAVAWFLLNGIIGLLYFTDIIDKGILILISLFFGVCDMICILFFCPFQIWFMKNRCCTVCRIYNWDFAMMFTPFLFFPHPYTWSLLFLSLLLLARWEIGIRRHPEYFSEHTNAGVRCQNCTEKLCHHKTQLVSFWRKNKMKFKRK